MDCNQCGKPAIARVNGHPLCVGCYSIVQTAWREKDIALKEQLNYLMAEAEAVTGLYGTMPRYEVQTPVIHQGPMTFHNIRVDRSVVGAINTGDVKRIDVALSQISVAGEHE